MVSYLSEYFTTARLECLGFVSMVDVWHSGEMVDILHSQMFNVYWRLLEFILCFYVMTGPHVKQPVADELSLVKYPHPFPRTSYLVCLSVRHSVCLSVNISVCLFVPSVCLSVYLPAWLSVCLSVLSVCLSVCLFFCLSVSLLCW